MIILNYQNQTDEQILFSPFGQSINNMHQDKLNKKRKKNKQQQQPPTMKLTQNNFDNIVSMEEQFLFLNIFSKLPPSEPQIIEDKQDFKHIERNETEGQYLYQKTYILLLSSCCQSLYIIGNYTKLQRFISQTPWLVESTSVYEESVSGIIEEQLKCFKALEYKFSSGGREDIDVRMLGNGRPFVIEIISPKRSNFNQQDIQNMQENINKSDKVNVTNLKMTNADCFKVLKQSENSKIKAYACIIKANNALDIKKIEEINNQSQIEISQKTPIRVLHRRSLMYRTKVIYKVKVIPVDDTSAIVHVLSSAGTYIKEFIHGDLNRTVPNLGSLMGVEMDIFQLDVIKLYEKFCEESLEDFNQNAVDLTENQFLL